MIVCRSNELMRYKDLILNLDEALAFAEELKAQGAPTGRHDFEGGFILCNAGTTKPYEQGKYENHQKYIDLQYILEGEEWFAYAPTAELTPASEYDPKGDIQFFTSDIKEPSLIQVKAGMCYIVFPEDGHMPARCMSEEKPFKKFVIKLPVKEF